MPEGDSVYLVARRLDLALKGRRLARTDLRTPKVAPIDLAGRSIVEHVTHGKHLLTRLSGDLTLHTHLRMQGSWTVTDTGKRLPSRLMGDVRVVLETVKGPTAYGILLPVVDVVHTSRERDLVGHLGPDPLRDDWDPEEAVRRLGLDPDRTLASALLDQRLMAGLGNLWVNEICFLRGHSPWTPVREVDLSGLVRLAARALRTSALSPGAHQVTTGNRRRGARHWVAGSAGRPCRRCGTPIRVVDEVANDPQRRRTWWCPVCQPGPTPDVADRRLLA
jgi:formamidopyrimidine-DNA glycosylase